MERSCSASALAQGMFKVAELQKMSGMQLLCDYLLKTAECRTCGLSHLSRSSASWANSKELQTFLETALDQIK